MQASLPATGEKQLLLSVRRDLIDGFAIPRHTTHGHKVQPVCGTRLVSGGPAPEEGLLAPMGRMT